ncbi:hypothetical protein OE165_28120, partial [Escherichia coli]|uniref:hypothetical protein n=1 Tax=Escherichia coli TaxID=562 RepID=UPI0021F29827
MLKVGDVVQIIESDDLLSFLGTASPIAGKLGVITAEYSDTDLFEVRLFDKPETTFPLFRAEFK